MALAGGGGIRYHHSMTELNFLSAYVRFFLSLAAGLFALSLVASVLIDHFFTEYSVRDYRLARVWGRIRRPRVAGGELDIEDISLIDLASQLTYGRLSQQRERELARGRSSRSYRSLFSEW